ncbi:hypothetical protein VCR17J2_390185 [Vibrio coralliirubri]|nr:hypothetical protein VCR17J2_390185 [Vibrio coralliirubri]
MRANSVTSNVIDVHGNHERIRFEEQVVIRIYVNECAQTKHQE